MAASLKKNVDFTKGNTYWNLIVFAIPVMAGELFQNLYHSTDSVVLGNFAGAVALAAVSVNGTLTNLFVGFCNGMSVGSTVVVAKAFGSGDRRRLEQCVCFTYTFSMLLGIVVSAAGFILAPFFVRIINASAEIYDQTLLYLRIYISGLIFTIVYNNAAGILRGMGDMRTPFVILLVSCSLNIVLDLVFCALFRWGIAGVAIATIISQVVSVMMSYHVLKVKMGFRCIDIRGTLESGSAIIGETLDVGVAAGFQASIISFSNLFVWRYINRFSTAVVAGTGISQRIEKFVSLPNSAYGSAVTTYVSQNIGSGHRERTKEGIRAGMILASGTVVAAGALVMVFGRYIAMAFNRDPEIVKAALTMVRTITPFYFMNSLRQILMGVLRANSRSKQTMVITIAGMVGVRQLYLAVAMHFAPSITTVYIGYPVGWGSALLFSLIYYFAIRRKLFSDNLQA